MASHAPLGPSGAESGRAGSGMRTRVGSHSSGALRTCRRCGGRAAHRATVELRSTRVELDLCRLHLEELLDGARPLPPDRNAGISDAEVER